MHSAGVPHGRASTGSVKKVGFHRQESGLGAAGGKKDRFDNSGTIGTGIGSMATGGSTIYSEKEM